MQARDRYILDLDRLCAKPPSADQTTYQKAIGDSLFNQQQQWYTQKTSPYRLVNQPLGENHPQKSKPPIQYLKSSRTLDAPEVLDDYYLNTLDWSSQDMLAVCLSNSVWIRSASGDTEELCQVQDEDYFSSVCFSPDGITLCTGNSDGQVQLYDMDVMILRKNIDQRSYRVSSLDWATTQILASGSLDRTIAVHDVRADRPFHNYLEHAGEICGLKWSPDGLYLASGGNDNMVYVWDHRQRQLLHAFDEHKSAVKAIDWCPFESNLLATGGGSSDRTIKLWNTSSGKCKRTINTHSQVSAVVWSRQSKQLASSHGYIDNHIYVWDYPTMNKTSVLEGHDYRVLGLKIAGPNQLVSVSGDETIKFWDDVFITKTKRVRQVRKPLDLVYLR